MQEFFDQHGNSLKLTELENRIKALGGDYEISVLPNMNVIHSDGKECSLEFLPDGSVNSTSNGVSDSWLKEPGLDWSGRFEIRREWVSGSRSEGSGTLKYNVWTPLDKGVTIIRPTVRAYKRVSDSEKRGRVRYSTLPSSYGTEIIQVRDKSLHRTQVNQTVGFED